MSKFNRNGSIQSLWATHGKQNWDVMAYTKLQQAACIGPSAKSGREQLCVTSQKSHFIQNLNPLSVFDFNLAVEH
jgi:hypothetical protein